jgi:hypothetical protein
MELVEGARAAQRSGHDHARALLLLVAAGGQGLLGREMEAEAALGDPAGLE